VRVEGGRAVRADDAQILKAIVIADAVDVIEDQAHGSAAPQLVLTAQSQIGALIASA